MKNRKELSSTKSTGRKTQEKQPRTEKAVNAKIQEGTYEGLNWSKPKLQKARLGVPMTVKVIGDPDAEMPLLADGAEYGRRFRVDCGEIYTLRLGIHSDPDGIGVIPIDTVAALMIPTTPSDEVQVTAMFALPEIFPAVFGDSVILYCGGPFRLKYLYGSAQLECNNPINANILPLGSGCIEQRGEDIIISYDHLENIIPQHCTYNYDFISVQVKVVFDVGN